MMHKFKQHAFSIWLFIAVAFAFVFPDASTEGGILHAKQLTQWGVMIIFFLLGASIPLGELIVGYRPIRLHAFVCFWNYLGFPLVATLILLLCSQFIMSDLALGFGLLAIMPTTIASAVAFTDLCNGSVSNAIYSTVLSNLLSVFIVPLLAVALFSIQVGASIAFTPLFLKIVLLVLLPLLLGQSLQILMKRVAHLLKPVRKLISSGIILLIVHVAFAQSVASNVFDRLSASDILGMLALVLLLLCLVNLLVWLSSRFLKLQRVERVAAFFCGSQKSLATGLPLAVVILALSPEVSGSALVLLPLIVYHPAQLVLAGFICNRLKEHSTGSL